MAEKKTAPKKRAAKKSEPEVAAVPVVVEAPPVVEVKPTVVEVTPVVVQAAPVVVSRDEVARRAYEIWKKHGGSAFDNWIAAERELGV
jgi:hypothetical protein